MRLNCMLVAGAMLAAVGGVAQAEPVADNEWTPFPSEGITFETSGGEWHAVTLQLSPGSTGPITASVSADRASAGPSGSREFAIATFFFEGSDLRHSLLVRTATYESAQVAFAGAGVAVERRWETFEGSSSATASMSIAAEQLLAASAGEPVEVTFLLATTDMTGAGSHQFTVENPTGISYVAHSGRDARLLGLSEFDAEEDGARAEADSGVVRAGGGLDLVHHLDAPCGATGLMLPPYAYHANFFRATYQNNAGGSGYIQSVTANDFTHGQRLLSFSSAASEWDFRVLLDAGASMGSDFSLFYAPFSPGTPNAPPC